MRDTGEERRCDEQIAAVGRLKIQRKGRWGKADVRQA